MPKKKSQELQEVKSSKKKKSTIAYSYVFITGVLTEKEEMKRIGADNWVIFKLENSYKCVARGICAKQIDVIDIGSKIMIQGTLALGKRNAMYVLAKDIELYTTPKEMEISELVKNIRLPKVKF